MMINIPRIVVFVQIKPQSDLVMGISEGTQVRVADINQLCSF